MKHSIAHERLAHELAAIVDTTVDELPRVFHPLGAVRPLQIGADEALLDRYPGASHHRVQRWFRFWTRSAAYHDALANNTHRFDLDGRAHEPIAAGARTHIANHTLTLPENAHAHR